MAASKSSIPVLQWHQVRPAPVVLVTGPETFLADRASRALRDLLKTEDPSVEVSDIAADQYQPGELMTLASPSLFAEPRLIRVANVEKSTDAFLAETIAYLEQPADDTYLLLRHGGGVRGKKLLDAIRGGAGGGIEIACAELKKDTDRHDFVSAEFAAAGRRITATGIRALVTAFQDDLAELAAACQQLLADSSDEITEVTVDKYYSGRVETNAFRVADTAIAGREGEALVLLRHAISTGADPVPIVAAFASKVRTMAKVSGARGGGGELARKLGMAPWQVDRARRDLQGWTDEGLANTITVIADTDEQIKGLGRDPVYALERMIAVIARRGDR
ncbi:DNA polymerase III subunit delta [Antiquaquibacter oligotrophicus]|uniref:DNA polymerase III subunit delta n=1 Tax=Antiquaquibacter oligotrophicus TaxID=2880260 RepID=UPI002AC923B3|nr:DNA polymerase III subunit delta [Antiquaquibacter oligotrophicus]UDF13141.1 DNA polymerase III subunit delta [Antiquaquibacter oligotrophicus]